MLKSLQSALRSLLDADLVERLSGILELVAKEQQSRDARVPAPQTQAPSVDLPCTVYLVVGVQGQRYLPLTDAGDGTFTATDNSGTYFTTKNAAETFKWRVMESVQTLGTAWGISKILLLRRVSRSKNGDVV